MLKNITIYIIIISAVDNTLPESDSHTAEWINCSTLQQFSHGRKTQAKPQHHILGRDAQHKDTV